LTELKGEVKREIILGDFNTPLSIMRITRQNISKDIGLEQHCNEKQQIL